MTDVVVTWKSWYGNEPLRLTFPDNWRVTTVSLADRPILSDRAIQQALAHPTGHPPIRELDLQGKRVCIAVDDLTKPTQAYRIIPHLLAELRQAGARDEGIYFVISLGTHRALTLADMRLKLGQDVADNYRVYNHNPYQNNRVLGTTSRGTPVAINALFLEADFKIGIGMLMPHNLAGFSGGSKIVVPGLASIETVESNHRSTLRGLAGKIGQVEGNPVREDIEEAAAMAGLGFIVNSVHRADGQMVAVACGDPVQAFRRAAAAAAAYYACDVPYQCDVGVFNAFPRDNWFLLSLSSLDVWSFREPERAVVRPGGSIVIINHCSEGAGEHGLHIKGMPHYVKRDEHGTFRQILAGRNLLFFSPNLNRGIVDDYYAGKECRVALFRRWDDVLADLLGHHPGPARAAVFPCGTLQMDRAVLELSAPEAVAR